MGLIQLYTTTTSPAQQPANDRNTEPWAFCRCDQQKHRSLNKVAAPCCRCGEDVCQTMDWTWDRKLVQPQTVITGQHVSFHPCYSQGTSIVRGDTYLQRGMIHYWEIKIDSWYTGTDLMVGVGTEAVDLFHHRYKFSSALGLDTQSWGYSYCGMIQHENVFKYYGKQFGTLCILGVYLDLFKGHLEFFINRVPQGIAYRNIPLDQKLYPMVCSTSAKSSVRLINASSFNDSLQFRCMAVISKYSQLLERVQKMPGLSNLRDDLWFMMPKERYQYSSSDKEAADNFELHHMEPEILSVDDEDEYFSSDENL